MGPIGGKSNGRHMTETVPPTHTVFPQIHVEPDRDGIFGDSGEEVIEADDPFLHFVKFSQWSKNN